MPQCKAVLLLSFPPLFIPISRVFSYSNLCLGEINWVSALTKSGVATCQSPPKEMPTYLCRQILTCDGTHYKIANLQIYNSMSHTSLLMVSFIHTWFLLLMRRKEYKNRFFQKLQLYATNIIFDLKRQSYLVFVACIEYIIT